MGDPVCSWCFAFTDTFEKIRFKFEDRVDFSYLMGGLVIDRKICLDTRFKSRLQKNWKEVYTKTGKAIPAIDKLSSSPEIPYCSDPPCVGFTSVKLIDNSLAYPFYKKVHLSFYSNLLDISSPSILCRIASGLGVNESLFMEKYRDTSTKQLMYEGFKKVQRLGVQAFPALVLVDETGAFVLNQGFREYFVLNAQIESWVEGKTTADRMLPVL